MVYLIQHAHCVDDTPEEFGRRAHLSCRRFQAVPAALATGLKPSQPTWADIRGKLLVWGSDFRDSCISCGHGPSTLNITISAGCGTSRGRYGAPCPGSTTPRSGGTPSAPPSPRRRLRPTTPPPQRSFSEREQLERPRRANARTPRGRS